MSREAGSGEMDMGLQEAQNLKQKMQKEKENAGDVGEKAEGEVNKAGGDVGKNIEGNVENAAQKMKEKKKW